MTSARMPSWPRWSGSTIVGIRSASEDGPIDEAFIREVAARRGITEVTTLVRFQGQSLRQFYNEAFCGGVILQLGGHADGDLVRAEAPMAFQSVLAGLKPAVGSAVG